MKRFYVNGPSGQVHCRQWGIDSVLPPIFCLSPAPFSSKAYLTLGPMLAQKRKVIALDYPGYGESDSTSEQPTIEDFACAVLAVVDHCSEFKPVDLFGFHSGCLVAAELAVLAPDRVNQLLLTDVPFFSPEKQTQLLGDTPEILPLEAHFSGLEKAWGFCVASKLEHIQLSRAYQMFVDYIGSGELANRAFRAAFSYPCDERFRKINTPTTVFATKSMLRNATRRTAETIPNAHLVELSDVTVAVLEAGAGALSEAVLTDSRAT